MSWGGGIKKGCAHDVEAQGDEKNERERAEGREVREGRREGDEVRKGTRERGRERRRPRANAGQTI